MKVYNFVRLKWGAVEDMSDALNDAMEPNDEVVNVSALNDEVLVLVSSEVEAEQ